MQTLKTRIISCRLLEKMRKDPEFSKLLSLENTSELKINQLKGCSTESKIKKSILEK